jgi:hypothetical protein
LRSLLLEPEEIDYKNGLKPLPETVDVLTVNVRRGAGLRRPKHLVMGWPDVLDLYDQLHARLGADCRILHFEQSDREALAFFNFVRKHERFASRWVLEVEDRDDIRRNWDSSEEHGTAVTDRPFLRIDKLRSRTARGVNRATFNVCVVVGAGLPSLGSFIPFTLAHRALRPHDPATIFDFTRYSRDRAVWQALMRIPRDPRPRACIWLNTDVGRRSLPDHIAVGAFDMDDVLPPRALVVRGADRMKAQVLTIADFVEARVRGPGNVRHPATFADDAARAASSAGPAPRAAISVADWMAMKFAERLSPDRVVQAARAALGTIAHICAIIRERGFLDRVHDKRGERGRWLALLRLLEECRFLSPVTQPGTSKTVYVRGDLFEAAHADHVDNSSGDDTRSEGETDERPEHR